MVGQISIHNHDEISSSMGTAMDIGCTQSQFSSSWTQYYVVISIATSEKKKIGSMIFPPINSLQLFGNFDSLIWTVIINHDDLPVMFRAVRGVCERITYCDNKNFFFFLYQDSKVFAMSQVIRGRLSFSL